mgnify:CR=1 FL=1
MGTPIVPRQVRKVFEGRVFTVQVESLTLPKGMALDADVVRHPGSVVIGPVTAAWLVFWALEASRAGRLSASEPLAAVTEAR